MKEKKKNLKILLAAPPFLPVGENISYGGSERVILGLYKALLTQGHDCFVAGTSDSELKNLIPTIPSIGTDDLYHSAIPLDRSRENTYQKMKHVAKVLEIANKGDFDIVHCHDDYFIPFFPLFNKPVLTTIHCCSYEEFWDDKKNQDLIKEKPALVVLSEIQKSIYEDHGWSVDGVVYNGIDTEKYAFCSDKMDFFFSMAIIAPHKGQSVAIDVANNLQNDLILAGGIGDVAYFDEKIKQYLDQTINSDKKSGEELIQEYMKIKQDFKKPVVLWVGELNDSQKIPLLEKSKSLLAPYYWDRSCPLVPIEAMACGTPVVTMRKGALPELIKDGFSGCISEDENGMVEAALKSFNINPINCRKHVEAHFSLERMAKDYIKIYHKLMADSKRT